MIKALRKERLWSQSQLAEVAGLSLRTVQRLEANGNASMESIKALAAVFEISVNELNGEQRRREQLRGVQLNEQQLIEEQPQELNLKEKRNTNEKRRPNLIISKRLAAVISGVLAFLSAVFLVPASAENILLDAAIYSDQKKLAKAQLLNGVGKESEMSVDDKLSVVIMLEKENDNQVRIFTQIFDLSNDNPKLVAKPELLTKNKQVATIKFGEYTISLTPHLNSALKK